MIILQIKCFFSLFLNLKKTLFLWIRIIIECHFGILIILVNQSFFGNEIMCFNQVTLTFQIENDTEIEQYRLSYYQAPQYTFKSFRTSTIHTNSRYLNSACIEVILFVIIHYSLFNNNQVFVVLIWFSIWSIFSHQNDNLSNTYIFIKWYFEWIWYIWIPKYC